MKDITQVRKLSTLADLCLKCSICSFVKLSQMAFQKERPCVKPPTSQRIPCLLAMLRRCSVGLGLLGHCQHQSKRCWLGGIDRSSCNATYMILDSYWSQGSLTFFLRSLFHKPMLVSLLRWKISWHAFTFLQQGSLMFLCLPPSLYWRS